MSILQASILLTNEPPEGLKANLLRAYGNFNEDIVEGCAKQTEYRYMLLAVQGCKLAKEQSCTLPPPRLGSWYLAPQVHPVRPVLLPRHAAGAQEVWCGQPARRTERHRLEHGLSLQPGRPAVLWPAGRQLSGQFQQGEQPLLPCCAGGPSGFHDISTCSQAERLLVASQPAQETSC